MSLERNLETKKELRFKNGKFRIVMFSDLHGKITFDRRTVKCVEVMTDELKPDLILLGGDTVCGNGHLQSEQLFRNSFNDIANIFESRKIPWAHVFGNHDKEVGILECDQEDIYESYEHCVSKRGPADVTGTSNWMLPIKASEGDRIRFNVWGMDSHRYNASVNGYGTILPNHFCTGDSADHCRPDQIMWYYNSSVELENYCGEKIPSIMYFHQPIPEFNLITRNPTETGMEGEHRERVCGTELNFGLFAFAATRGDVKGIYCGHDHINTFSGTYAGVHLGYIGGLGFNVYMHPDLRCCRVFEIDENDPANYKTYLYKVLDNETLAAIQGMHDCNIEYSMY